MIQRLFIAEKLSLGKAIAAELGRHADLSRVYGLWTTS